MQTQSPSSQSGIQAQPWPLGACVTVCEVGRARPGGLDPTRGSLSSLCCWYVPSREGPTSFPAVRIFLLNRPLECEGACVGHRPGSGTTMPGFESQAEPVGSCVTFGESLNLSVSWLPRCQNKVNKHPFRRVGVRRKSVNACKVFRAAPLPRKGSSIGRPCHDFQGGGGD